MKQKTNVTLHLKDSQILVDLRLEYTDYVESLDKGGQETCQEFGDWAEGHIVDEFLAPWSKGRTQKRHEQQARQKVVDNKKAVKDMRLSRATILEILNEHDSATDDPDADM